MAKAGTHTTLVLGVAIAVCGCSDKLVLPDVAVIAVAPPAGLVTIATARSR